MKKRFILLLFALRAFTTLTAQHRFEAEIRAFERLDSLEKAEKGQIMLLGSSTFRLWSTYKTDLSGYKVVNRGFGGSEMSDALYYFDRVVLPLQPSWILIYEGDNDLGNGGKTPAKVLADFEALMKQVKQKLPKTKVAIYTLRPSLARESKMPQQRELNALFKKYCKKNRKKAYIIDMYEKLLTPDGKPNGDYLVEDKLHLNAKGYTVWTQVTRDFLKKQGL